MTDRGYTPDWENSDSWSEFEWEQALKYSDHLAARYFRMLERFGDLPDAEEFIVAKLGDHNFFEFEDPEAFGGMVPGEWPDEWDDDEELDDDDGDEDDDGADPPAPGDSLYFESCPVYQRARQVSLGWCNILASVLAPEDRWWGLSVLLRFGRMLSYLSISLGDGTFERVDGSIAFAKRALSETNAVLGELDAKNQSSGRYVAMFRMIREHLLEHHDMLIAYLMELRDRREKGGETADLE